MSRRLCARRPFRVCLFTDDQQGTLAAHIYARVIEEWASQEVGARNGGVYTDLRGQCLVTD